MELTQDEKNTIITALREFAHTQKSDLDRAKKEPEWAEKWAWVLHKTQKDYDTAQAIIKKLENQNN